MPHTKPPARPGDHELVGFRLGDHARTVEKFHARGEGRAAADLFLESLMQVDPEVAALLRKVA